MPAPYSAISHELARQILSVLDDFARDQPGGEFDGEEVLAALEIVLSTAASELTPTPDEALEVIHMFGQVALGTTALARTRVQ